MKGHPVLAAKLGQLAEEELVGILTRLTRDVERFQETVAVQQRALERRGALDDDELTSQAQRLSREAKNMAAAARRALQEMRRLSPNEGSDQLPGRG